MTDTFKTVFWSLFGLAEKEGVLLDDFDKGFTEVVGYLIYGTFNIVSVIVLLNMLIAMMSKSYETIEEHADVEWKFARSKLYMEYIKEGKWRSAISSTLFLNSGGTLPVPFNIIPTIQSICYLFRQGFSCLKRWLHCNEKPIRLQDNGDSVQSVSRSSALEVPTPTSHHPIGLTMISAGGQRANNNDPSNYRTRQRSFDMSQTLTYHRVIGRIRKRFLLHKQREEQEEIREGDFEELKQDIQSLRFELLNRLDIVRYDLSKHGQLLTEGVMLVGELLSSSTAETNVFITENFRRSSKTIYSRSDSGIESTVTDLSATSSSMSVSTADKQVSNSDLYLSASDPTDLDIQPLKALKHLTAIHVKLSNILEEEEFTHIHGLKFIDDDEEEEEIDAQHASTQTPMERDTSSKF